MSLNMQMVENTATDANVFSLNEYTPPTNKSDSFELVMSQINIPKPCEFKAEYIKHWQEASVKQELLTVLLCEIDYLDEYYAHYGEQGASFMLVTMALLLKTICAKHNCFLARNDQQGFNILIQGGTPQQAQSIADSLCEAVKSSNTEHLASKIGKTVTLSIGSSSFNPVTPSLQREQADRALRNAQGDGGNRSSADQSTTPNSISNYANTEKHKAQTTLNSEIAADDGATNPQPKAAFENATTEAPAKTYRGQIINNNQEDALKSNNNAPEQSAEPPKKKKVRMYRGQIVKD